MKKGGKEIVSFVEHEVQDYERKRYRGLDQRLVDRREKEILRKILDKISGDSARVLDLPSGYGRFSGLFLEKGIPLVSSDLSFHMVKRAVERSPEETFHAGVVSDAKKVLPFQSRAFTLLVSMRFFHHVHRKKERQFILQQFSDVSSRWVVLSFYKKNLFHTVQRRIRRKVKKSQARISMIARSDFQEEAEKAGLKTVQIFPLFRAVHAHHIALLEKI
ncbi:MAG: class I SAM-dependent methyltransferase [Candidatus Aminicenantes bacterium]